jgi:hypothetical protein
MKDGVGAVGVEVDLDPRLDEMRPQRAWWDLQLQRPVGHAIVVLDLALLLNAQDLVEIDARNRREGRAGLGGGHGEAGVVDGQVDLADKGVGRLDRDDPREPELLRQPVLERPERPLRAPSRLGRRETPVSRRAMPRMSPDISTPSCLSARPTCVRWPRSTSPPFSGGMEIVCAASSASSPTPFSKPTADGPQNTLDQNGYSSLRGTAQTSRAGADIQD